MKQKRMIIWGSLALLIGAVLAFGLRPQPVLVEVATAERNAMQVIVEEEGKTRVKDRYVISAPVSGFIRRIEWKVGHQLEQNQLLTELEPLRSSVLDPRSRAEAEARIAAARSALLSAEEQVAAAKADAEHTASEFLRKQKLHKTQLISAEELSAVRAVDQRAQAMLRSAKFAVDVARYDLDAAGTLLKYSAAENGTGDLKERVAIRAPVNGSLLKVHRESEGVVSAGTPLIELGDPGALEVAVDVLSFDAVQITPGVEVKINRWGGTPLEGYVRLVEPVGFTEISALGVEEQRVWVIVDITSNRQQWQSLGDGYRVEASFILWSEEDVLQIPNSALFRVNANWAVYVVEDDKARLQQVELGQRNGLYSQVLSGVNEHQQIIMHPDNSIEDGARVMVR